MPQIVRFGVSMNAELLAAFDTLIAAKGYANRSEAIRDLVRDAIVSRDWQDEATPSVGALCLAYDPRAADPPKRLARIRHEYAREITASLHVRLDAANCLEVIILQGKPSRLRRFADRTISTRGIKHGKLMTTATGKKLP